MAEPKLEQALRDAVTDLDREAASHKRLEKEHRLASQRARESQRRLINICAEFGIEVIIHG